MPWDTERRKLQAQFSPHRDQRRLHVTVELETCGLFYKQGERETNPVPYLQSIEDFIAGLHSRSAFAKQRMGEQRANEFDQQVRSLLLRYHSDGVLQMQVVGTVIWGWPAKGLAG